jgi:alpha-D-xyloside xylohydrolase
MCKSIYACVRHNNNNNELLMQIRYLDFWVSVLPAGVAAPAYAPLHKQYADATGHAPPLREDAMLFWQSRNRYKSSAIALAIAERYSELALPVGVLVIDFKNQVQDGDFAPNPACYPSVANLSAGVRELINATTVFSFWPEVLQGAQERDALLSRGCLINADLGGLAIDATIPECRDFIWTTMLKPRCVRACVRACVRECARVCFALRVLSARKY